MVQFVKIYRIASVGGAIDFTLGGVGVPRLITGVSDALMHFEQGTKHDKSLGEGLQKYTVSIQVISVPAQATVLGGKLVDIAGEYDSGDNILQFPFSALDGKIERAGTVVHECTHAALDIGPNPPNEFDGEAAARIAQSAYLIQNAKATGTPYNAAAGMDMVFQRAAEVMLAYNGCYIFPETHRSIMHRVLRTNGCSFGEDQVAKHPGWGPRLTM